MDIRESLAGIEHEIAVLLRRADFKRTLDGSGVGLDRSAYLLLKLLEADGPRAIGDIAAAFRLDLSTVSRQVGSLEARGSVRRTADAGDARVSRIGITPSGQALLDEARRKRVDGYGEALADWSAGELETFARLLAKLNGALHRRKPLDPRDHKEETKP